MESGLKLGHLGAFYLPKGIQDSDPGLPERLRQRYAKFGYGGRAMCLGPSGQELWISGHPVGDLVAAVRIPEAGYTASLKVRFHEVTPRGVLQAHELDTLVGLAFSHGDLCALWQEYYQVDGQDGGRVSFWNGERLLQVGFGELKKHAGYLAEHEGVLYCGRSDAAGSASVQQGPALYEIIDDSEGSAWLAELLLDARSDWTRVDRYTALVFLPGYFCWLVRKAVGEVWYGGPVSGITGEVDETEEYKGWHADKREAWLLPYTWPGLERRDPIVLSEFGPGAQCGGVAYDEQSRRLYVHELWPPEKIPEMNTAPNEQPRIHVYDVPEEEDSQPEPEPEREQITVEVTLDGDVYAGDLERKGS